MIMTRYMHDNFATDQICFDYIDYTSSFCHQILFSQYCIWLKSRRSNLMIAFNKIENCY